MKIHSVKYNFIMNTILTAAGIVFPLITFPYISRVLLVEGNGRINAAISIVTYFTMFASLGIPTYGIRACAVVRDDREKLSRTVQELLVISMVTTALTYLVFFASLFLVPAFREDRTLLAVMGISIGLTTAGVQWFYTALEQYSYITVCSILFKLAGIVLMFLFVKNTEDYLVYSVVYVIGTYGSNVLNFVRLRKFISFKKTGTYEFGPHIKKIMIFFAMSAGTNIYLNLDVVMLKFMQDNAAVGYYSAGVKVKTVLVTCVTSLGTVLLPRLSYYIGSADKEAFARMIGKAFSFVFLSAGALTVYFSIFARESILLLSGEPFLPATGPMIILMPTVLLIGLSNITGIQILLPYGREKQVMYSIWAGALLDLVLNLLLIPKLSAGGAAVATLVAEAAVLAVQCRFIRGELRDFLRGVQFWKIALGIAVAAAAGAGFKAAVDFGAFVTLVVSAALFFGVYGGVLLLLKEAFTCEILGSTRKFLGKRKKETD